jgi:hypothetical protein
MIIGENWKSGEKQSPGKYSKLWDNIILRETKYLSTCPRGSQPGDEESPLHRVRVKESISKNHQHR